MKHKCAFFLSIIAFIHFQLIPMPGTNRIKGKVRNPEGNPIPKASIIATPCASSSDVRHTYTDKNGKWALAGLYHGSWNLTITAPSYISRSVKKKIRGFLPNRLNATLDKIPPPDKLEAPVSDVCRKFMKAHHIPGMAIGVAHDNRIIFTGAFGSKHYQRKDPITSNTVFNLASISKLYVAAAITKLAQQGVIDLDAPVADYLPYFQLKQKVYRFITIRHLLTHSSGLPRGSKFILFAPERDDGALKRSILRLKHLDLPVNPGGKWRYSNIGYNILGALIAEVTGQSFESYIRDHIFLPLEMYDTTYFKGKIPADRLACPHFPQGDATITTIENDHRPYAPSAGLFSTLSDMIN
jgi:CubicO group peptidase (beta-lactamase class C family)